MRADYLAEAPLQGVHLLSEALCERPAVGQLRLQRRSGETTLPLGTGVTGVGDERHLRPVVTDGSSTEDLIAERARLGFVAVEERLGSPGSPGNPRG